MGIRVMMKNAAMKTNAQGPMTHVAASATSGQMTAVVARRNASSKISGKVKRTHNGIVGSHTLDVLGGCGLASRPDRRRDYRPLDLRSPMKGELHRFWFRFAISPGDLDRYASYAGLGLGCGVTAFDPEDARRVLQCLLFGLDPIPEVEELLEDVAVADLDQGRIVPNMGAAHERGIWFPRI